MNRWIEKSIEVAGSRGYLDSLFKIYPTHIGIIRDLPGDLIEKFKRDFGKKHKIALFKDLLNFPKFPVDDPYIASLRRHPFLIEKNPQTINRISKIILSMDLDTIIKLSTAPQKPSRQLGNVFRAWLQNQNFRFLNVDNFKKHNGAAFLNGDDNILKNFAINELEIKSLRKGLDFILKVNNKYFVGEAKFLTDYGGTQNNQFRDAINVAKIKKDNVSGIAILDGIVWFKNNSYMHKTISSFNRTALSALLLKAFIKEQ